MEIGLPAAPVTEKLLASLLCKDKMQLETSVNDGLRFNDFAEELLFQVGQSGLIGLFYERACEIGANELFKQVQLTNEVNFFDFLEVEAKQAAIRAAQMDERFLDLCNFLDEELPNIIWLKSTVLARTLYNKLNYRVGIDFDVVVKQELVTKLVKRLKQAGWEPLLGEPGHCHQIGVGPVKNLTDLFLVPQNELEGCHNLTMIAPGWPHLELKFNPLDNGVLMKQLERFHSEAIDVHWHKKTFKAPSLVDHLIVELVHLHKHRLIGFGWIHDIHLLCQKLNENPDEWTVLMERVSREGVGESCRMSLLRVRDLLKTEIPVNVLTQLDDGIHVARPLVNMVSTEFVWNANGLPMLVLNAVVLGDGRRKMRILKESLLPGDQFLSAYYFGGKKLSAIGRLQCLLIHWLVLLLPAGVIRQSFGKAYWKTVGAENFRIEMSSDG